MLKVKRNDWCDVSKTLPKIDLSELSTELIDRFQQEANTFLRSDLVEGWTHDKLRSFLFTGIGTEGGEVQDIYKKQQLVSGNVDTVHLREELGDLLWHIATLSTIYGMPLRDVFVNGMEKFRKRHPHRFAEVSDEGN